MEHWKAIAGYEGLYEVSDLGRVKSLNYNHTGIEKILKPGKNQGGYLAVILCKDGKHKYMRVNRLVAQAFLPNPLNLPQVNHRDEDKLNNAASNLEWCTASYNINFGTRNRRVAEAVAKANRNKPKLSNRPKPVQQLDKQGNLLATFPSTHEAERITGIRHGNICQCCLGRYKSAGGFVWKFS